MIRFCALCRRRLAWRNLYDSSTFFIDCIVYDLGVGGFTTLPGFRRCQAVSTQSLEAVLKWYCFLCFLLKA